MLIEALAIGIPVVSADCENRLEEILKDGKFGRLVSVELEEYILPSWDA